MSNKVTTRTKIGVLLVHGVGEQRQFNHTDEVVRNFVASLNENNAFESAIVNIRTSLSGSYGHTQQTWSADKEAPVFIEVLDKARNITEIHFREVWWADLDEPSTIRSQFLFWWWGLGLWTVKNLAEPSNGGYKTVRPPLKKDQSNQVADCANVNERNSKPRPTLSVRARLFWVSLVIFLVLPTLALIKLLLRPLGLAVPINIISEFIGDVKLYSQAKRIEKGPLVDMNLPPRVTIRRRMAEGLAKMAYQEYDRWYIMAHSQGTVVALNGLMESEHVLPNYLSKESWENIKGRFRKKIQPDLFTKTMVPRPGWLDPDDAVDRRKLFSGLKGIMTYGSPLKKFAVLWPAMVPLNVDETDSVHGPVFKETEWINIYDPMDPVASATKYFHPCDSLGLKPQDIAYKAHLLHLLSHTQYLTYRKNSPELLVNQVTAWMLQGQAFTKGSSWRWLGPFATIIIEVSRVLIWILAAFTISVGLSYLVPFLLNRLPGINLEEIKLPLISYSINLENPLFYVIAAFSTVLLVGCINWLRIQIFSSSQKD